MKSRTKSLSAVGYLAGGLVFVRSDDTGSVRDASSRRAHGNVHHDACVSRSGGVSAREVEVANAHLMSARLWLTVTSSVATKREKPGHLGFHAHVSHEPRDIVAELLGKLREGGGDEVARV